VSLLAGADLPTADIAPGAQRFIGVRVNGQWCGVIGIETMGTVALLRSLAVAPGHRCTGIGARLVIAAEGHARTMHAAEIFLLTRTAAAYFSRRGYERIARDEAPAPIRASSQFTLICPASATLMRKRLGT
jgi:N-acetylglutamate synthase-like GNAT family acetyltransferase